MGIVHQRAVDQEYLKREMVHGVLLITEGLAQLRVGVDMSIAEAEAEFLSLGVSAERDAGTID